MMNIVFLCQEYKKNAEQFFPGTISDADKKIFSDAANCTFEASYITLYQRFARACG